MEILFWAAVATVAYSYVGYPLLLAAVGVVRRRRMSKSPIEPTVTIIIAAYNEERDIQRKLEMVLALDYPADKREVIVTSDCSTDRTHEIVRGFAQRGVKLCVLPARGGKTAAQNMAVSQATGEILVFTDATTDLSPDVVRKLVQAFADPSVGCAGAELEYRSAGGTAVGKGGGLYWRYEKLVKALESRANSLIGVSGCLYAVRRKLFVAIPPDLISDFVIALDVFAAGHVTTYVPGAVVWEDTHEAADREFNMRTRVIVRSIHALVQRSRVLNPLRTGLFALQLWSHKVLRYLVPELLLLALAMSVTLALSDSPRAVFYQVLVGLQLLTYIAVPVVYSVCRRLDVKTGMLSAPFYFVHANAAAFWALVRYLRGRREVTWTTVR